MKELTRLKGTVESLIYQNDENGFTVFTLAGTSEPDGADAQVTCVGSLPFLTVGEPIEVVGSFVNNPRYGLQLSVESFEKTIPNTVDGMQKYLGSGVITGVGERLAKKIVKAFGESTFTVIAETPEKLAAIKGITLEKAMTIGERFHEQAELRRAMLFLQDYGVSPTYALKIYKRFREATEDIVKSNPYYLADEITGIGFKIADSIAARVGFPPDSPLRIKAGLRYALSQAAGDGHVYLPKDSLIKETATLLQVPEELAASGLTALIMENTVIQDLAGTTPAIYLPSFFQAENYVAQKLLALANSAPNQSYSIFAEITRMEEENGIWLADMQKEAIAEACVCGALVITGGPGTGKTTAINTMIKIMKKDGLTIELAAPTGRAAKRMSEATGMEAKTIHRLLEISFMSANTRRQIFQRNEDNPLETNVIIIDESSMVDILLMHSLLKAIAPGTRLILVGDVDQLPSVGPGNVLRDIIECGCLPVVRLTEIFRQARESAIVMNAHRINRGQYPVMNEKDRDFFFINRADPQSVVSTVIDLMQRRLPGFLSMNSFTDIQILTPMRKSGLGVLSLNQVLQHHMNPPAPHKKEKEFRAVTFREGDKVMQIKNNYDLTWRVLDAGGYVIDDGVGVFNGDEGVIKYISEDDEKLTVLFDDNRVVDYNFSQLEELELSYAITIHKSQGSEYRVVIIPIHSGPPLLMTRNLLYTAVTRAKELAVIVGIPNTLRRMVDNHKEVNRYTSLADRILSLLHRQETAVSGA